MDTELKDRLAALEKKIDDIRQTADIIKKVFIWTIIITIVITVVLPLIGLMFVIPQYLSGLTGGLQSIQGL